MAKDWDLWLKTEQIVLLMAERLILANCIDWRKYGKNKCSR